MLQYQKKAKTPWTRVENIVSGIDYRFSKHTVVQLYQRPSLYSNECIYPSLLPIICFIVIIYHVAEENDANLVNHGLPFYCVPALKMVDSCPKL